MIQMLVEAEKKVDLKSIEQIAKTQGFFVRYIAGNAARKEKKSKNPLNPSPSGDPWWDDPRNAAMVAERVARIERGEAQFVRIEDSPAVQELFAMCRKWEEENV